MKFTTFIIACYILVSLRSILPSVLSLQKVADPFCDRSIETWPGPPKPIKILLIQRFRAEWAELNAHHVTGGVASHTATITFHYLSSINQIRASIFSLRSAMASLQGGSRLLQAAVRLHSRRLPRAVSPYPTRSIPVECHLPVIHLNLFPVNCPFFKGEQ